MERNDVLGLASIRVSGADFCRLRDAEGRYLLLRNRSRARKGKMILTPVGGGIMMTSDTQDALERELGFVPEKPRELRGTIPGCNADRLRAWFLGATGIEEDTGREFVEELGPEEEALLTAEEARNVAFRRAGYYDEIAVTTKQGAEGQLTLRLIRVYDASAPEPVVAKLLEASPTVVRWVTEEEILACQTVDGAFVIGEVSLALVLARETIQPFES